MRRFSLLVACLGLAGVSAAQKGTPAPLLAASASGPEATGSFRVIQPTVISQTQNLGGGTTLVLDISGEDSWDALNDSSNTVLQIPLGAGAAMTGIGWDVNLSTIGGSWLSEARFYFDGSDLDLTGLFLTPGVGNSFPGSANFNNPVIDLTDVGIPDIPILADGILYIQLNESFDDVNDSIDANWTAGSTLTITYEGGAPAVPTTNQWGLLALGGALLGGVVFMSMRRRSAAPALAAQ